MMQAADFADGTSLPRCGGSTGRLSGASLVRGEVSPAESRTWPSMAGSRQQPEQRRHPGGAEHRRHLRVRGPPGEATGPREGEGSAPRQVKRAARPAPREPRRGPWPPVLRRSQKALRMRRVSHSIEAQTVKFSRASRSRRRCATRSRRSERRCRCDSRHTGAAPRALGGRRPGLPERARRRRRG
jgi:hypothetical protein